MTRTPRLSPGVPYFVAFPGVSLVALLAVFLANAAVSAADTKIPKNFYQRDFAAQPGGAGSQGARRSETERGSAGERGMGARAAGGESAERRGSRAALGIPGNGKRSAIVEVTVNSLDHEHMRLVVESVMQLHDQRLAMVLAVHHVGDYRGISPELEGALSRRGISVSESYEIPKLERELRSPVWRVVSPQGVHIAEGVIDIRSLFNEMGEYDPKLRDPALQMEGF